MKEQVIYECWSEEGKLETRRTDKEVAQFDASILHWLGKKTWVEEVRRAG
jgi:hypothetical protein